MFTVSVGFLERTAGRLQMSLTAGVRGADCVFCMIGQRVDCFRKLRVTAEKAFWDTCDITGWAHLMDGGVQLL